MEDREGQDIETVKGSEWRRVVGGGDGWRWEVGSERERRECMREK